MYVRCFIYGLDTTVSADINNTWPHYGGLRHVEQLAQVDVEFLMGFAAVILPAGDLLLLLTLFLVFVALFGVSLAVCGAALKLSALIVGSVLAGVGGSGIYLGDLNSNLVHLTTHILLRL